jgi:hypothetical protein
VHDRVEQLVARLAARLGVIHRRVRVAHDFFRVVVLRPAERDADARRREHLAPADRERCAQRFLNPERDRVGLLLVLELVEENRELVAAEAGERVPLPQARLETARDRHQELVSDQVAEAVVDDLEAIEVEIKRGEAAAAAALLEFLESAAEPFDEYGAVAQTGQRIAEPGAAQLLLGDRALGRVGQRAGDADRAPAGAAHRRAATQEAPIGSVLVTEPVLVMKMVRLAGDVRFERILERRDVVGVDAAHPFVEVSNARERRQTDHRAPAAREVALLGTNVELPQAVVRAFCREREAFFAAPERVFSARLLGDVAPQQRHAATAGEESDLEDARARGHRQPDQRQRPRIATLHCLFDRARQLGLGQRRQRDHERAIVRARTRTLQHACEGVVPRRNHALAVDGAPARFERAGHALRIRREGRSIRLRVVGAVGEEQRRRDHRQDFPGLAIDHLGERHRDAGADEVGGAAAEKILRPRTIDRRARNERHHDLGPDALDEAIGDDRGGDRHAMHRPHEAAQRAADGEVSRARRLKRGEHDRRVHERADDRTVATGIGEAFRDGIRAGDEHRGVRTEEQQRDEFDDEGRRHRGPVFDSRTGHREG